MLVRGRVEHVPGGASVLPDPGPESAPWPDDTRSMLFCLTPDAVTGRELPRGHVDVSAGRGPGSVQRDEVGPPHLR